MKNESKIVYTHTQHRGFFFFTYQNVKNHVSGKDKRNRFDSIKMEQISLRKDIVTRSVCSSRKYLQCVAEF